MHEVECAARLVSAAMRIGRLDDLEQRSMFSEMHFRLVAPDRDDDADAVLSARSIDKGRSS